MGHESIMIITSVEKEKRKRLTKLLQVPEKWDGSGEKVFVQTKCTECRQLVQLGRDGSCQSVGTDEKFLQANQLTKRRRKGTRKSILHEIKLSCGPYSKGEDAFMRNIFIKVSRYVLKSSMVTMASGMVPSILFLPRSSVIKFSRAAISGGMVPRMLFAVKLR